MASDTQPSATELTSDQYKYLEWVATPKSLRAPKSLSAFAKGIGVDRTTLWRWSQIPTFKQELRQASRALLETELPDIYAALVKAATGGDVPAIKLALEVSGEYTPRQKVDMDFSKLSDDELQRIAAGGG